MIGVNAETSTGMGAIGRMQVVVRYERVSHLYRCTPERQSLCESHRQRRWLTCWSYDFVIVGAGSAGCVVARRLVDGTDATVLVLEAGGSDAGVQSLWDHRSQLKGLPK